MNMLHWPARRADISAEAEEVARSIQYSQQVVAAVEEAATQPQDLWEPRTQEQREAHASMLERAAWWPECFIAAIALVGCLVLISEHLP
jgi:hypothetical protein